MTLIVSSNSVKLKFEDEVLKHLPLTDWVTRKSIPFRKSQINFLIKKSGLENGVILIFVKYGQKKPSVFPEICLRKILITLVYYRTHNDISIWIKTLVNDQKSKLNKALVLAMMKPFYLHWGEKIYQSLRKKCVNEKEHIFKHFADDTTKGELSLYLSQGCSLAIYVGHGRSRGWSGYRGVRWKDVATYPQKKTIGSIISLSCSSLKQDKEFSLPFGLQWVMEGRCSTFLGSIDAVEIKPLAIITEILLKCISKDEIKRMNELIVSLNDEIVKLNNPDVSRNWESFRLIGNPYQWL